MKTCLWRRRLKLPAMSNPDEIDKQNVASLNARENPSRFPPVVQIIGYPTVRPSVPVVVWAFPSCVISLGAIIYTFLLERARHKTFLCCQLRQIKHAEQTRKLNQKAIPLKTRAYRSVNCFFYYAKCSTSY